MSLTHRQYLEIYGILLPCISAIVTKVAVFYADAGGQKHVGALNVYKHYPAIGLQALDAFESPRHDGVTQSIYHRQGHGERGSRCATLWNLVPDGPRNVSIMAREIFYSCPLVEHTTARTRPSVWEIPICRAAGEAPVNHGTNAEARAQLYDVWRAMCDNTTTGSVPSPTPSPASSPVTTSGSSR